MENADVLVIGGGPAGSSCAWRLTQAGASVIVLDREEFPRTKLCAGWITPEVVSDLEIDPERYPHRFNTFDGIVVHIKGLKFTLPSVQHSIRRYEFDDYLLKRSKARVFVHNARTIESDPNAGGFTVDGRFRARYLVGAGGTRCPVYRSLFRDANPRARELQAATYEHEIPYEWKDERCHLWFFDKGLPGYAWYVPKQNGYLNCGIGAIAEKMKAKGADIKSHWQHFARKLERRRLTPEAEFSPKGYSYYLRGNVDVVRIGNAFITGDSAGLATRDLCEGIGPAVRSGFRAADAITEGSEYRLHDIAAYSSEFTLVRWLLERNFAGGKLEAPSAPA
ncbi:MAG: NAD(P)/FAD-dependent oxidoreductase [Ectothiorhodospiraceae bacterium AqS1]|nr:NAD(P)/FAD-dependent oxidoreductase [Ectothiorhodospiraceae bacterium AqS1]